MEVLLLNEKKEQLDYLINQLENLDQLSLQEQILILISLPKEINFSYRKVIETLNIEEKELNIAIAKLARISD